MDETMSVALEAKIEELVERLNRTENTKPLWSKFNLATIITIVVLTVGVLGSWFTLRAEVGDLRDDLVKVESVQEKHTEGLQDVQLKGVQDSSDIKHIKTKVESMDRKLDQLLGQ